MKKVWHMSVLAVFVLLTFSTTAFAYLDPSVMTYTIQVVAGVVIAVGAVIGIYWRKARKKVQDKLGIDENAHKTVEEDVIEFSEKNNDSEKKQ